MSHKRKGQMTVSGEWKKHLRPLGRRVYWKAERQAERDALRPDGLGPGESHPCETAKVAVGTGARPDAS